MEVRIPDGAYEAAERVFDAADPQHCDDHVGPEEIRVAVEAVWALAEAHVRQQIADDLRAEGDGLYGGMPLPEWLRGGGRPTAENVRRTFYEHAAKIAGGESD